MEGLTLHMLRRKAGVTQAELARRLGTSQAGVSRLEARARLPRPVARNVRAALAADATAPTVGPLGDVVRVLKTGADGTAEQRT